MKAIDHLPPQPPAHGGIAMMASDLLREAPHGLSGDRPTRCSTAGRSTPAPVTPALRPAFPSSLAAPQEVRGGLARWQIARILRHIDARLDGPIPLAELAGAVRLSPGYFSRAFKQSFGTSPHAYVMMCRIERAKTMLLTTAVPLCDVALDCGLADQAHLSRVFRRLTGETPCAWRRRCKTSVQLARRDISDTHITPL